MKKIFCFLLAVSGSIFAYAQHTTQGKIEFERRMNIHRTIDQMDEENKQWIEKMRSQIPKHSVQFFDMSFTNNSSLYKPGRESEQTTKLWFAQTPAAENIVFTDFTNGTVTAEKLVFEQRFLVKDSMRKIKWKIHDEVRTIANYKCRKAVGVMFDSVYVIAFYTEDIIASGGPEMFSGLPGMILEVAIPRLHTTWTALKVEYNAPDQKEMIPPKKGKPVTQKEMQGSIGSSLKNWGEYADKATWWATL